MNVKFHRGLMKAAAAACVIAGLGSAAASASPVPATFSSTGGVRETGSSLSWYADGVLKGSCAPNLQSASFLQASGSTISGTASTCNGGAPTWFQLTQSALKDSGVFSLTWHAAFVAFPGYTVNNPTFSTPWANGTIGTPSQITLNNTVVGTSTNGKVITVSGVLNVTTAGGGLLTLS